MFMSEAKNIQPTMKKQTTQQFLSGQVQSLFTHNTKYSNQLNSLLEQNKELSTKNRLQNQNASNSSKQDTISQNETVAPPKKSGLVYYKQLPRISIATYKFCKGVKGNLQIIRPSLNQSVKQGNKTDCEEIDEFVQAFPQKIQLDTNFTSELNPKQKKKMQQKLKSRQRFILKREKVQTIKKQIQNANEHAQLIKFKSYSTGNSGEINCFDIAKLFAVSNLGELMAKQYVKPDDEDPFYFQAYKHVFSKVKSQLLFPGQELKKVKKITLIVRKILDQYVVDRLKLANNPRKLFFAEYRRLSQQDRMRYLSLNIQPPTSRVDRNQLSKFFKNADFKQYFVRYVTSDRFLKDLVEFNQQHIVEYQLVIQGIQMMKLSTESKLEELKKRSFKPFMSLHVHQYDTQARLLLTQFA